MRGLTRRSAIRSFAAALVSTVVACGVPPAATRTPSAASPGAASPDAASPGAASPVVRADTVASGLVVPWALAFARDGRIFVTERPGRVRVIRAGQLLAEPALTLADVAAVGEGGLLGMALDPSFAENGALYLYYTYRAGSDLRNRVVRYVARGDALAPESRQIVLDGIPGASTHDGGRIAFGPDGLLYVATGDAARRALAQDLRSLAGKILRIKADGSIPPDNPFLGSPVYSYGHRNPQGLAWQPGTGRLYSTEHGQTANDEVNLIQAGGNYGWPDAEGKEELPGLRSPVVVYANTVAPAGATFYTGAIPQWRDSLIFGALRGTHLHLIRFGGKDSSEVAGETRLFQGELGRLREVAQGPDGALYVTTSNRDGRGTPVPTDDRVLRIVAA